MRSALWLLPDLQPSKIPDDTGWIHALAESFVTHWSQSHTCQLSALCCCGADSKSAVRFASAFERPVRTVDPPRVHSDSRLQDLDLSANILCTEDSSVASILGITRAALLFLRHHAMRTSVHSAYSEPD